MKIYLAGPMRNIEGNNRSLFYKAAQELEGQGHEVFNPATVDPNTPIRAAFAIDCEYICEQAEAVYLLRDWETSRGARAESALAMALGLRRFIQAKGDSGDDEWFEIRYPPNGGC